MKKKCSTYGPEIKAQALVLYSTGMSYHAIARSLKISSHQTIRRWIDPKAAQYTAQYYQENKERINQYNAQWRQENKERIAQYRQENKERIAQYNAQWHQENKERISQQKAQYRQENKERINQQKAQWYQENKERINQRQAQYRQENKEYFAQWRQENKERIAQYKAQYRQENPEKVRAQSAKRRASKRSATPPWFTSQHQREIEALQAEAVRRQQETGTPYHVDHIYPLKGKTIINGKYQHTSCGLHVPWNMRVLSGPENCSKNCKMPDPAVDPPTAW